MRDLKSMKSADNAGMSNHIKNVSYSDLHAKFGSVPAHKNFTAKQVNAEKKRRRDLMKAVPEQSLLDKVIEWPDDDYMELEAERDLTIGS